AGQGLAGDGGLGALAGKHLVALRRGPGALSLDREHVALDGDVDRVGVGTRQVEAQLDMVAVTERVHRHPLRPLGTAEDLLGEPVEVSERVIPHQHAGYLRAPAASWPPLGATVFLPDFSAPSISS